jgi:hypothetical protein
MEVAPEVVMKVLGTVLMETWMELVAWQTPLDKVNW